LVLDHSVESWDAHNCVASVPLAPIAHCEERALFHRKGRSFEIKLILLCAAFRECRKEDVAFEV